MHLVRDGRDVMLSRLDTRMSNLKNPINNMVVFGESGGTTYRGKLLTPAVVEGYRNELEMHHWVTAVKFGMRARRHGNRYLEVRYEDLCMHPVETLGTVFQFLDVPYFAEARDWIRANASTQNIGKWKDREEDLSDANQIGKSLLRELGYV